MRNLRLFKQPCLYQGYNMLIGKGTTDNPLISSRVKLMDFSIMLTKESNEEKAILIIEQEDELHALAFDIEDIKWLIEKGIDA